MALRTHSRAGCAAVGAPRRGGFGDLEADV